MAGARLWASFATVLVFFVAGAAAQSPPWTCGTLRDYYAKTTTECAPASCNAKQVNLQGDVIILDVDSYGETSCQGCNPSIPSTCCKQCQDTDGCNAWTFCSLPGGCGSGCQAYMKQFKAPASHNDRLPHPQFGNFKNCAGDKFPANMCTLKFVKDTAKPIITSTKAADGWVSGVVPKGPPADPRCPPTMSAKTCKACVASRNPAKCLSCITTVNTMFAVDRCTLCANLTTPAAIDACVACAASPDNYECTSCTSADADERTMAPNLASVDACFACQARASGAPIKPGSPVPAKATACGGCFSSYVPKAKRADCLACVAGGSDLTARGCSGCFEESVQGDTAKCLGCVKRAKAAGDAEACASCSKKNNVPAGLTDACYDCVFKVSKDAKSQCSNLDRETQKSSVELYYKCLATAQDSDRVSACWQCYRNDPNAQDVSTNKKCYDCIAKVTSSYGLFCTHCWGTNRVKEGKAAPCESCVLAKQKAKGDGGDCI